jgi:RNA polymerase sigma-54 factor
MRSMEFRQSLSLGQFLSPQMQQSLALLQANLLELQAIIQQELNQNPLLEDDPQPEETPPSPTETSTPDNSWKEYFSQSISSPSVKPPSDPEATHRHQQFLDSQSTEVSLSDYLFEQLLIASPSPTVKRAAEEIIWNLDENGFLQATLEDITFSTGLPYETIQEALTLIQSFDPAGVGARDISECLAIQLQRHYPEATLEVSIVTHHLTALAKRHYSEIARALGISRRRVVQASKLIQKLNPRPAAKFAPISRFNIVRPEIIVEKIDNQWTVSLLDDDLPKLRINNTYKDLLASQSDQPEIKNYLREKLRSGQFLIRSIALRQETLLAISQKILQHQIDFFEKGPDHLRPLTMNQIATDLGIHETTVSRAIANKYLRCPHGIFPLRHFFNSAIKTQSGATISNTTAKEHVAEIIKNEDPQHPLSDQEIQEKLAKTGIVISRRTIAKYRLELGILPSNLRRQVS